MYLAVNGIFEDGQLILEEPAPTMQKTKVVVMFLNDENKIESSQQRMRQPGSLKKLGELEGKKYSIPDDFNEPLDDLKEYM